MVVLGLLAAIGSATARANENEETVIEARALTVPFIDGRLVGGGDGLASSSAAGVLAPGVCAAQEGRLPTSVQVERAIQPRIQEMLERSSTFREQCRRLAQAPWMHVAVRQGPYFLDRLGFRAYSTIQRPQPRLFVAVVTVQASADPAMWIGHEFEHLLEQLDDVDVRRQADSLRHAWYTRHGMVETGRAIRVGMRVYDEVRDRDRDNLVE